MSLAVTRLNADRATSSGVTGDLQNRCEILLVLSKLRCAEHVVSAMEFCDRMRVTLVSSAIGAACEFVTKNVKRAFAPQVCGSGRAIDVTACSELNFPTWFSGDSNIGLVGVNSNESALDYAYERASTYLRETQARMAIIGSILEITVLAITPCCFLVVYAFLYKYQHYPSFHNCYIYRDFAQFAQRWNLRVHEHDLKRIITFWTPRTLPSEWQGVERLLFSKVWVSVMLGLGVITFSHLLSHLLVLINQEARVSGRYDTEHNLSIDVIGIGFVARCMRILLGVFVSSSRVSQNVDTAVCIVPHRDSKKTFTIFAIYVLMVFSCIAELYALRFRFVLCSYFYPEAHKRRMLYLCQLITLWHRQRKAINLQEKMDKKQPTSPAPIV